MYLIWFFLGGAFILSFIIQVQSAPQDKSSPAENNKIVEPSTVIDEIDCSSAEIKDEKLSESSEESVEEMLKDNGETEFKIHNDTFLEVTTPKLENLENANNDKDLRQLFHRADSTTATIEDNCRNNTTKCNQCNPNTERLKCYNETTVALCTRSGNQRLIRCTGLTPVCHPTLNICSNRRLVNNPGILNGGETSQMEGMFKCPSHNGYYPDMNNCRIFYYCIDGKPYLYKCAVNEVYNPLTRSCSLQTLLMPCRRFMCESNNGRYTTYPGDPSVYALCSNNQPVDLYHCPEGETLNNLGQQCQLHCTEEGLLPDHSSCSHYYECIGERLLNRFKSIRRSCPTNMVFSPLVKYCVPIDDYPACNKFINTVTTMIEPSTTTISTYQTPTSAPEDITTSYDTFSTDSSTTSLPTDVSTMQYIY